MKLEGNKVVDHIGTVLAEKIRGEWHTKDNAVLQFIMATEVQDSEPVAEEEYELEMVRARDEKGHFIADDPNTPEVNEAWVVKTIKKVVKK
jgi:hypothetical protein